MLCTKMHSHRQQYDATPFISNHCQCTIEPKVTSSLVADQIKGAFPKVKQDSAAGEPE